MDAQAVHQKTLVDIQCSNSLIEAHNKVIKYNYVYKMSIKDRDDLNKVMPWTCNDFNNRPISLNGLTPNESYENIVLDSESLKEQMCFLQR